jgi:hypothetical protein
LQLPRAARNPRSHGTAPTSAEHHDIDIAFVEDDLRAAGLEIQQRDVEFVKFKGVAGGEWLLRRAGRKHHPPMGAPEAAR